MFDCAHIDGCSAYLEQAARLVAESLASRLSDSFEDQCSHIYLIASFYLDVNQIITFFPSSHADK